MTKDTGSLAQRLTLAMWLLSAVSCLLAVFLSTFLIIRNSEKITRERIADAESTLVSLGFLELLSQNTSGKLDELITETLDAANLSEVVQIYAPPGLLLQSNMRTHEFDETIDLKQFVDHGFFTHQGKDRKFLSLIRSYRASNGKVFWLEIATPRPVVEKVIRGNALPFSLIFIILIFLSWFAARFVALKSLAPLTQITHHLDLLDSDRIKQWQQIPLPESPKDFRSIIIKVNELIMRVQSSSLKFYQIGQYIAHELRTPLTIIRGEIETSLLNPSPEPSRYMSLLESALDEVTRMDEIVSTVLRLSSRDRKLNPYRPESVELLTTIRELQPTFERLIQRKIFVANEKDSNLPAVFIDRELFVLLISNLLRNIGKHTPAHCLAEIRISPKADAETSLVVEISDTGPGLPEQILREVNDSTSAGEHLGLGLTLCREIAQTGFLSLSFENRDPKGLVVRIRCPLASASQVKGLGIPLPR